MAVLFYLETYERSWKNLKKIKSYTGIWNVEKVLYAINDFNLPFPVTFTQILCLFWKRDKINISLFPNFYNGIVGLFLFVFDSFYQGFFSLQ